MQPAAVPSPGVQGLTLSPCPQQAAVPMAWAPPCLAGEAVLSVRTGISAGRLMAQSYVRFGPKPLVNTSLELCVLDWEVEDGPTYLTAGINCTEQVLAERLCFLHNQCALVAFPPKPSTAPHCLQDGADSPRSPLCLSH